MNAALLRLLTMSTRGRLVRRLRQLRQPKYLIGFIIGVGWIWLWLGRWTGGMRYGDFAFSGLHGRLGDGVGPSLHFSLSLSLALLLSVSWLFPVGRLGLPFKESELHLLLPAPLTRREVIQFALLKAQLPILLTTLVFSIILGNGRMLDQLRLFLALWVVFTLWEFLGKWQALFRLRLRELSPGLARTVRGAVVAVIVGFWIIVAPRVLAIGRAAYDEATSGTAELALVLEQLAARLQLGVSGLLMKPFLWITAPAFASTTSRFLLALIPGVVLLVVLHEAVVRSRARFEEPALEQAKARASRRSPGRRLTKLSVGARRRIPFALPTGGRPELAVLWKNLMQVKRVPVSWFLLGGLVLCVLIAVVPVLLGAPEYVFAISAAFGSWAMGLAPLIGTMSMRIDFRTDLGHIETVRTWPLAGWRLMFAEVLGPALVATYASLVGGGVMLAGIFGARLRSLVQGEGHGSMLLPPDGVTVMGFPAEAAALLFVVGFAILAFALAVLIAALLNLGTLLFPAWVGLGPAPTRGMAAMGHQLVFAMGLGLVVMVGLIPGAMLAGAAVLGQYVLDLPWNALALPLWGLLAAGPLLVEAALVIRIGGRLWENLDPTNEILESGR